MTCLQFIEFRTYLLIDRKVKRNSEEERLNKIKRNVLLDAGSKPEESQIRLSKNICHLVNTVKV